MRAYKGFHKDLNCTMGKGVFYYEPGKWYREQEARCADTGSMRQTIHWKY